MRQLQYQSPSVLEWIEVPRPKLEKLGDALVKPLIVSRCELDRFIALGTLGWSGGFGFGHEIYGEVVEVDDHVQNVTPGDRVLVPFQLSCGQCGMCRKGYTALCETFPYRASYGMAPLSGVDYGGGLSDLVRVPFADHMLVHAPSEVDPITIAGVTDTVSTAHALIAEPLAKLEKPRVLIVGGNTVALNSVRFAVGLGADKVVLVDSDEESLQIAKRLGAIAVKSRYDDLDNLKSLGKFQMTVDATGSEQGLALAIYKTDHEGLCQSTYGGFVERTPVPLQHMYGTHIILKISRVHARHNMPKALDLIKNGCVHAEAIVSHEVPFSQAGSAVLEHAHGMVFIADD